ncbi:DUF2383 domain-containing protein [Sphingobacterium haloxyli]|uniref:Uncharacterized protein n=1 Tax=Sphingobacterium haloxyli TaxID=2100533 RepID=A0A2S9IVL3_9SPHI|nr:DUF2383 domain-containing protein [Sphingobacterium haloxyli]PRD44571.1 hypothetical protein C5745_18985 [Sphingobacterium haloxyli]
MKNNKDTHTDQLHDFIQILTERVEVYANAIASVDTDKDVDLIAFYEKCMQLSQQFKSELLVLLPKEGISPSERQWTAGTLYQKWEKRNPCIEPSGREQALESCIRMEEFIKDTFKQMLLLPNTFSENTTATLQSQAALQQEIYELLKDWRSGSNNLT